jgi:hypothetical protein
VLCLLSSTKIHPDPPPGRHLPFGEGGVHCPDKTDGFPTGLRRPICAPHSALLPYTTAGSAMWRLVSNTSLVPRNYPKSISRITNFELMLDLCPPQFTFPDLCRTSFLGEFMENTRAVAKSNPVRRNTYCTLNDLSEKRSAMSSLQRNLMAK